MSVVTPDKMVGPIKLPCSYPGTYEVDHVDLVNMTVSSFGKVKSNKRTSN